MLILWSTTKASILRVFRSVYPCASPFAAKEIGGPMEAFAILDIAVHPGGDHVTAVCANGSVRVWGISDESDDPLRACFLSKRPVGCVVVSPEKEEEDEDLLSESSRIVVAAFDGSVQVFNHPTADSPSSLQHLARRALRKDRFHEGVDELSLPTRIKRFLKMEEFKPELTECDCESRFHQTITRGNASASSTLRPPPATPETRGRF